MPVHVSAGAARVVDWDVHAAFEEADNALYEVKRKGKGAFNIR